MQTEVMCPRMQKSCPVVKMGKLCIEVKSTDKIAFIPEFLCIGCGICVKKVAGYTPLYSKCFQTASIAHT
ncbi:hypothetical protein B0H19DRAFT_518306 [Mycena capillaripes]|nr:hypothetical protein B0H19DRAFT_518306 [Mycena capillaripes]